VLREFAMYNPISAVAAAARSLFGNPVATPANASWPLTHPVLSAFAWCLALIACAAPLTIARYRARTAG
jgi:ABC-2 type transport system permease protein